MTDPKTYIRRMCSTLNLMSHLSQDGQVRIARKIIASMEGLSPKECEDLADCLLNEGISYLEPFTELLVTVAKLTNIKLQSIGEKK